MSADSWETFVALIGSEAQMLDTLQRTALVLTDALAANDPTVIDKAQREVEAARIRHMQAAAQRRSMQQRGFGTMTLTQVAAYAPPPMSQYIRHYVAQMTYSFTALGITNNNNKALIVGGMDRLVKIVSVIQRTSTEQTGTYKRRGTTKIAEGSVLVSRRA